MITTRLDELSQLKHGWLDGIGEEISPVSIELASMFLKEFGIPFIYPMVDGGVSLETTVFSWDISVDGPITLDQVNTGFFFVLIAFFLLTGTSPFCINNTSLLDGDHIRRSGLGVMPDTSTKSNRLHDN